ncbi:MAG: hypothetical protein JW953_16650 [Anaerolineae bacterium]|nr:hypothetical protein [Anaerolineae bacterium]
MTAQNKMPLRRQIRLLLPIAALMSLALMILAVPTGSQAQGPVLATPTNIGNGGGGGGGGSGGGSSGGGEGGKDDQATPIPDGAAVSGFVYNYSTAAYEGGVTIVIQGEGWQVETVSDSNGYYRIGNLGVGNGVVNLRLPPGAHPVVFNWPIWLYHEADLQVDLGFYWGDEPPMPLLLSGYLEQNILTVQVTNRAADPITGGIIDIETPGPIRVSPAVEANQNVTVDYSPHQLQLGLGNLPGGGNTTVKVLLKAVTSPLNADQSSPIRVIFRHNEQYTPQLLELELEDSIQSSTSGQSVIISQPLAESPTPAALSTRPAAPDPTSTAVPTPLPTATVEPSSSSPAAEPTPLSQLPVTGFSPDTGGETILLCSAIIVLGLAVAGWWSLKTKTKPLNLPVYSFGPDQPEPPSPYTELFGQLTEWEKTHPQSQSHADDT